MSSPYGRRLTLLEQWLPAHQAEIAALAREMHVSPSNVASVLRLHTSSCSRTAPYVSNQAASQLAAKGLLTERQVHRCHTVLEQVGAMRTVKHAVSAGRGGGKGLAAVRELTWLSAMLEQAAQAAQADPSLLPHAQRGAAPEPVDNAGMYAPETGNVRAHTRTPTGKDLRENSSRSPRYSRVTDSSRAAHPQALTPDRLEQLAQQLADRQLSERTKRGNVTSPEGLRRTILNSDARPLLLELMSTPGLARTCLQGWALGQPAAVAAETHLLQYLHCKLAGETPTPYVADALGLLRSQLEEPGAA